MTTLKSNDKYLNLTGVIVTLTILIAAITIEYAGYDLALARLWYDADTQSWPWHDNWLLEDVLHVTGVRLIGVVYVGVFIALIASFKIPSLRRWRRGFVMILIGGLLGSGIVSLIKSNTHIYMPRKIMPFGGFKPYVRLFDHVPSGLPTGHAFPAGHASGGYGLVCFFFLFRVYAPKYQWIGLLSGLTVGMVFGIAQQMRGEHFLSHDLISIIICWWSAWSAYRFIVKDKLRPLQKSASNEGDKP